MRRSIQERERVAHRKNTAKEKNFEIILSNLKAET